MDDLASAYGGLGEGRQAAPLTVFSAIDREDFKLLEENARRGRELELEGFAHLDQPIGWRSYIRIANDVKRQFKGGRLLDWGCGYGQMTYLLRRRGLNVVAFDIAPPESELPPLPICHDLQVVRTLDEVKLPFPDDEFDAVLSCGVLEHVEEASEHGDERLSLVEIHRILRPGGVLFIYQLPQKMAWQEAILRKLGTGYTHPRRYTGREIRRLLGNYGYRVTRLRRSNFIPRNLTGLPDALRGLYSRASVPLILVDRIFSSLPGLNRFAGALEVRAEASS